MNDQNVNNWFKNIVCLFIIAAALAMWVLGKDVPTALQFIAYGALAVIGIPVAVGGVQSVQAKMAVKKAASAVTGPKFAKGDLVFYMGNKLAKFQVVSVETAAPPWVYYIIPITIPPWQGEGIETVESALAPFDEPAPSGPKFKMGDLLTNGEKQGTVKEILSSGNFVYSLQAADGSFWADFETNLTLYVPPPPPAPVPVPAPPDGVDTWQGFWLKHVGQLLRAVATFRDQIAEGGTGAVKQQNIYQTRKDLALFRAYRDNHISATNTNNNPDYAKAIVQYQAWCDANVPPRDSPIYIEGTSPPVYTLPTDAEIVEGSPAPE